jgi:RNA polymerase sigma-70 factor (ECF subfamily)
MRYEVAGATILSTLVRQHFIPHTSYLILLKSRAAFFIFFASYMKDRNKDQCLYRMDERDLIAACVKGNIVAQRELYDKYAAKMLGVCLRYAGNRDVARDLLHDGFIRLFNKIKTYRGEGAFEGWMRKLFVNTALEYLRKKDALREYEDYTATIPAAEYSVFEKISADELLEKIAALPAGYRAVFNLYAIEGYSHREIADLLHISESASRSQYTRARQYLQEIIKETR